MPMEDCLDGSSITTFRFGQILVDLSRGRLFRASSEIQLRPKTFDVLAYLVRHAGRVVPKDELIDAVWPRVVVTEDSLTQCIHEIRRALGPEDGILLRTVARRGYLFGDNLTERAVTEQFKDTGNALPRAGDNPDGHIGPERHLRRDGIAVLPFSLVTVGNPAEALLVDGLAHDVISNLARMRGFHVIARSSTFALRHLQSDPRAVGRALGVLHVVTGTATIRNGRLRLLIDIVEAEGAGILWTGEFSDRPEAYAEVIGALTDRIAYAVQRQITAAESRRALALPAESLGAWEHFHAGLSGVYSNDPGRLGTALEHFRAANRLAPGFARAYAGQSVCHWVLAFSGMTADLLADVAAARRTAEAAMEADDEDPYAQWCYGRALGLEGDARGCLQHAERSIAISHCFAEGHFEIGMAHSFHGDPARAIDHTDIFFALNPLDPGLYSVQIVRAMAEHRLGRAAEAAQWACAAAAHRENFATVLAPAALIVAGSGNLDEAQRIMTRVSEVPSSNGARSLSRSVPAMSPEFASLYSRFGAQLGF